MLDVERHEKQGIAEHAVEVGEHFQVAEVQVDVLAGSGAALAPVEELPVGVDAEELALLPQVLRSFLLAAEVEDYALFLHVGHLLLDGQQGLGAPCGVGVCGLFGVVHAGTPPILFSDHSTRALQRSL